MSKKKHTYINNHTIKRYVVASLFRLMARGGLLAFERLSIWPHETTRNFLKELSLSLIQLNSNHLFGHIWIFFKIEIWWPLLRRATWVSGRSLERDCLNIVKEKTFSLLDLVRITKLSLCSANLHFFLLESRAFFF